MQSVSYSGDKIETEKFDSDFEINNDVNHIKTELVDHEESEKKKNGSEKVLPGPTLTVEFGDTFEEPGLKVRKDLYQKKGTAMLSPTPCQPLTEEILTNCLAISGFFPNLRSNL